jgi:hypothetical protein
VCDSDDLAFAQELKDLGYQVSGNGGILFMDLLDIISIRGARAKASMLTMIGFWKRPWKYVSANITSTMIPIYCYVSDDQR